MKSLLLLILSLNAISASAQQFTISADKMNIMYVGFPSPLSVTVNGVDCKDLVLKADSEVIERLDNESCNFTFLPVKKGTIFLSVFKKTSEGEKYIGKSQFRVKEFPDPVAKISRVRNDTIGKKELSVQLGIIASLQNCDCDAKYRVTQYTMLINRNQKTIFSKTMQTALFDEEIKEQFKKLQSGDFVLFYDIKALAPDRTEKSIDPIYLKVIE